MFNKITISSFRFVFTIAIALTFALFLSSCKKANTNLTTVDTSYFPLKLKSWIVYEVTSVKFDRDNNGNYTFYDSSHYLLKEIIDTTYVDYANRTNYRIERYKKAISGGSWEILDVWSACITNNRALKNEENITYVKILFPAEKNTSWNGNACNSLSKQTYKITSMDEAEAIGAGYFPNVLTVLKSNTLNAIEKYYSYEKYAKNIGLVKKYIFNIYYTFNWPTIPIEQQMKTAEKYDQVAISWGTE